jgi:hypothetical protein
LCIWVPFVKSLGPVVINTSLPMPGQERRFAVLISTMMSSQTKDEVTHGMSLKFPVSRIGYAFLLRILRPLKYLLLLWKFKSFFCSVI